MGKFDKLQRVPIVNEDGLVTYAAIKKTTFRYFNEFLDTGCTILQCVNGTYYYKFEEEMDMNGMDKLIAMVHGMLFMMEHDDVEPDQAYSTMLDIRDFETGEYDDLFNEKDLIALKKDIQIVKEYLEKHPELLN